MDDYQQMHFVLLLSTLLHQVPICTLYELQITSNGSTVVGDELHVSCIVAFEDALVMHTAYDIVVTWEKEDTDEGSGVEMMIGFDGTIMLNPVEFRDRGKYVCSALFSVSNDTIIELSEEYNLTIQFPPVFIQIFNPITPFFVGDQTTLICQIEVKHNIDIPFTATTTWSRENATLKEGVWKDLMKYNFTLQLHAIQSGVYACGVMMQSLVNDPYTKGVQSVHSIALAVYDYPVIRIEQSGIQNIGSSYRLSCIVDVDPVVIPSMVWELNLLSTSIKQINESVIYFDSLEPQDAGIYTCNALVSKRTINASITLLLSTPYNITLIYSSSFYIGLSWDNPLFPSATLTNFTLTAISRDITLLTHTVPLSLYSYTYNITGLSPYQNITIILVANTILSQSIPVSLVFQTDEYIPGPVKLYISIINSASVLISWSRVAENQTNGIIRQYLVTVSLYTGDIIHSEYLSHDVFNTVVKGLAEEVRYTVEVKALNSRIGISTNAMFYTVEGVLPPPQNITVSRLNKTHIIVRWTHVNDTRGFVEAYQVMYGEGLFQTVPNNINTIVIGELDPGTVYTVRIAVVNSEGNIGEWSDPVTHEMSRIIQLRGSPFKSCTAWNMQDKDSIVLFFQTTLNDVIHKYCSCTVHIIFFGEILSCDPTTLTNAIYRGNIIGISPYSSDQLVTIIEKWIASGANATTGVAFIAFDPTCPVALENINDPLCTINKESDDTNGSLLLWSVISPLVILLCLLMICITVIVSILWWRSKRIQTWSFRSCETPQDLPWINEQCIAMNTLYHNNNVQHYEEADELAVRRCEEEQESGVYDPSNLTVIYESDDSNIES